MPGAASHLRHKIMILRVISSSIFDNTNKKTNNLAALVTVRENSGPDSNNIISSHVTIVDGLDRLRLCSSFSDVRICQIKHSELVIHLQSQ